MLASGRRPLAVVLAVFVLVLLADAPALRAADELQPGVRGLITRAAGPVKIDGDLAEFAGAFCTPVNYFHPQLKERAAQFLYMWDDEAFYCGLRTLDSKQANHSSDDRLWEGDGVEWYFDTRRGDDFRARNWGPGAVHMYWTAYNKEALAPRWCLRPDMLQVISGKGVEVGGRKTSYGAETEFKLPWANFPDFAAKLGAVIALDSELCYSDGAGRVDRIFAYGSPLSVQQPASQGKVQLVDKFERSYWKACGPVMAPFRCDTAWNQETRAMVTGLLAIPPDQGDAIGKIVFRVADLEGAKLGEFEAKITVFSEEGNFARAEAQWPNDVAPAGGYQALAILYDKEGKELARIAPRLVSAGWVQGY